MMNFFVTLLTAMAVENVIFAKGLGSSKFVFDINKLRTAIKFGGIVTLITTVASLISYYINSMTQQMGLRLYHRGILFIIAVCIVYGISCFILRRRNLLVFRRHRLILALASFNPSVHGALLLAATHSLSLWDTIAYSLGSGIGFTVALVLIYNCKRRIAISKVPKTFRGLPISLIYIGILSLAIYGLIGYQLPS